MKVVIVNKSDSTGGAAVVGYRLMEALRQAGVEVRMLVAEKTRDDADVAVAASGLALKRAFLTERLGIFLRNGFELSTLFQIDTASDGVALCRHRWIREADVICLNWVNQGLLSLRGMKRLLRLGKPVVWTMHDMWNMTGICHHAGSCGNYMCECGDCRLMGRKRVVDDLSHRIWCRKMALYEEERNHFTFVAVSNWLQDLAYRSSLLSGQDIEVIPNALPMDDVDIRELQLMKERGDGKKRIVIGAARLDDPIKGIDVLREATLIIRREYTELASRLEIVAFGNVRNPASLQGFGVELRHIGKIDGEKLADTYRKADIVVSSSEYETLPGTLVEGQAWGCVPVAFDHGGQSDIIDHKQTGYLAEYSDDLHVRARSLADGLVWAATEASDDIIAEMRRSVESRFSAPAVASEYIALFNRLLDRKK